MTDRQEAINTLRGIVQKVVVTPGEGRGEMTVQLHGKLAEIIEFMAGAENGPSAHRPPSLGESMVAREGFEPPTKGL